MDVKEFRRIYGEEVEKVFKVKLGRDADGIPVIDFHHEFLPVDEGQFQRRLKDGRVKKYWKKQDGVKVPLTNREVLMHRFKYAFRMAQEDIIRWANDAKIDEFTEEQGERIEDVTNLPKNWRRERWWGWLADGVRQGYCSWLGILVEKKKERKERELAERRSKPVICPIHKVECEDVGICYYQMLQTGDIIDMRDWLNGKWFVVACPIRGP